MKNLLAKKESTDLRDTALPKHIAIIMDGNRRWAKNKNIPSTFGHKEGVQALKKITRYVNDLGIKYLTVYAFSTENWNRKKNEVDFLMLLIQEVLKNELQEIHQENVKLNVIGFWQELPKPLPEELMSAMEKTKNNTGLNLQLALNYGSRAEITHATKEIAKKVKDGKLNIEDIQPETISEHLLTAKFPDPDLLIRTGGEQRISNYLLWQCAYAEFYSTDTVWPDFTPKELDKAIEEFRQRQRRFGL
ncbi:MAG: isoprenyl transferase [Candidatus Melainabacteria bacterium]|nr:isoprenyl transferase [Candidatus Melainabacteria bacterium]MBI3308986.1 isoprenyl transferase [Candidatus Melainabacteria bacterium]